MTWRVMQTRRFSQAYKKLHDNVVRDVNQAAAPIAANPGLGEKKKEDLAALYIHKFHSQSQLYLLGYTRDDDMRLIWRRSGRTRISIATSNADQTPTAPMRLVLHRKR